MRSSAGLGPEALDALCEQHPELRVELREAFADWSAGKAGLKDVADTVHVDPPAPAAALDSIVDKIRERQADPTRRYESREEIARGGMGAVHRVVDQNLRRTLAMKVILPPPDPAGAASVLARFLEEAQITSQLDHPGIVPVHELGIDSRGHAYFTMKLVKGEEFGSIIEKAHAGSDGWTITRAVGVILRAGEAMAYAHSKGVIHRDLKPSNVMVGRFGETYVMDWGVARVLGAADPHDLRPRARTGTAIGSDRRALAAETPDSPLLTIDGHVVGTPAYMAPEQAEGRSEEVDARSDVYAIGAMLYELLTGQMPYVKRGARVSPHAVLQWVLDGPPKSVRDLAPDSPPPLVAICDRAMARDPERRYATMSAFVDDVRAYLEQRVVKAYRTGPASEFAAWIRRNPALALIATAAVVVIGSLGFLLAWIEQKHSTALGVGRDRAEAGRLLAIGQARLPISPRQALMLALESARLATSAEATQLLLDSAIDCREVHAIELPMRDAANFELLPGRSEVGVAHEWSASVEIVDERSGAIRATIGLGQHDRLAEMRVAGALLFARYDTLVAAIDVETGRCIFSDECACGAMAIASEHLAYTLPGGKLALNSLHDVSLGTTIDLDDDCVNVGYDPQRRSFLAVIADGTLVAVDPSSLRCTRTVLENAPPGVTGALVSSDGPATIVAVQCANNDLRAYAADSGLEIGRVPGALDRVLGGGRFLVRIGGKPSQWNLFAESSEQQLLAVGAALSTWDLRSIAEYGDGFVCASDDLKLRVLDQDDDVVCTMAGCLSAVQALRMDGHENEAVVLTRDGFLHRFSIAWPDTFALARMDSPIRWCAFERGTDAIVAVDEGGTWLKVDASARRRIDRRELGIEIDEAFPRSDSQYVAFAARDPESCIAVVDARTGSLVSRFPWSDFPEGVTISADARLLLIRGTEEGHCIDIGGQAPRRVWHAPMSEMLSLGLCGSQPGFHVATKSRLEQRSTIDGSVIHQFAAPVNTFTWSEVPLDFASNECVMFDFESANWRSLTGPTSEWEAGATVSGCTGPRWIVSAEIDSRGIAYLYSADGTKLRLDGIAGELLAPIIGEDGAHIAIPHLSDALRLAVFDVHCRRIADVNEVGAGSRCVAIRASDSALALASGTDLFLIRLRALGDQIGSRTHLRLTEEERARFGLVTARGD